MIKNNKCTKKQAAQRLDINWISLSMKYFTWKENFPPDQDIL